MKNNVFLLAVTFILISTGAFGQTQACDTLYEFPDKEASFKDSGTDLLYFFNDQLLELIHDTSSDDFPPTSFRMILVINDRDEVESIARIQGDYSEETKNKILEKLQNAEGWKSGESNGQKVCSNFYFTIGCILWK